MQQYKQSGMSMSSFAEACGISEENIRRWKNQEFEFKKIKNKTKARITGRKTEPFFNKLEQELFHWIRQRNVDGLKVKDKYILIKMGELRRNELEELESLDLEDHIYLNQVRRFRVSRGWLERFKSRFNLVSRRVTSTRSLPAGWEIICKQFLAETQLLITTNAIPPGRIVNFDQVPRYFELESPSTITVKGSKQVHMKKASSSHKRFTFTPAVSGDGKIVSLHVLFSKLKKKPAVNVNCNVDVNSTGMWSQQILQRFIDHVLLPKIRRGHEPVLIILDSYAAHLSFIKQHKEKYEMENVYFAVIPKNLTSILQPLDVALNKSFQDFFEDAYSDYLSKALISDQGRTKAGNVKIPSYSSVSDWVHAWSLTKSAEDIKKAFTVCGLVDRCFFDRTKLHPDLRACFAVENVEENLEESPKKWFEDNGEEWLEEYHDVWLDEHRKQ